MFPLNKILIVVGTRPEAIKMAPIILELKKSTDKFDTKVCVTAQHREMLDQVLDFFAIQPDYDLDIMKPNQTLHELTANIISNLKAVLDDFKPDYVFVHGDTTTTMASSLAAFYNNIKVCHVEAGLRTHNLQSPFPEEMNRMVTGVVTDFHFSPTCKSKENLLKENKKEESIFITGNTVIDALFYSVDKVNSPNYNNQEINNLIHTLDLNKKQILITGHRRENHGQGFVNICKAIKQLAKSYTKFQFIYPVHLNPNVKDIVHQELSGINNISLIAPLSYPAFVWLMEKSYLILTDSGGVQEEAPSLGKPVLVMRENTERPEAVDAGTVILVGTDTEKIINEVSKLIDDKNHYSKMSNLHNPYGDGNSSKKIIETINQHING